MIRTKFDAERKSSSSEEVVVVDHGTSWEEDECQICGTLTFIGLNPEATYPVAILPSGDLIKLSGAARGSHG